MTEQFSYPSDREETSAAQVRALEALLIEKGVIAATTVDKVLGYFESEMTPLNGKKIVARAWVDPEFAQLLATDTPTANRSARAAGRHGRRGGGAHRCGGQRTRGAQDGRVPAVPPSTELNRPVRRYSTVTSPPSALLLIMLPPFPMHAAFPRSEYYNGSATTRYPQRASHLPANRPAADWFGRHRAASHVH
jgi:hypothetical protein